MTVGSELFSSLKGFGYLVELFQEDGTGPIANPDLAHYLYAKDKTSQDTMMIRLPESTNSEYPKLVVYKSEGADDKFVKLLKTIKSIAITNGCTVTIRQFGKSIEPKDFAFISQAKKEEEMTPVNESTKYEKTGSSRSSYHVNPKEKNARVIIRHSKKIIDEGSRGARSRNVKSLYVESLNGERRLIETKSLMAARAVANHVNKGGSLFDSTANQIITLSEDIKKIRDIKKKYPISEDQSNVKIHSSLDSILEGLTDFMKDLNSNKIGTLSEALNLNPPNVAFAKAFYSEKLGEGYDSDALARGSVLFTRTKKFLPQ